MTRPEATRRAPSAALGRRHVVLADRRVRADDPVALLQAADHLDRRGPRPLVPQHRPHEIAHRRIVFNEPILFAWVAGEKQSLDLLPGLARAQCPVLVMAGAQDPVCPLEDAQDIAAALPARWSRLAVFERSGHGAWRDEPDAAFALLREFILEPA